MIGLINTPTCYNDCQPTLRVNDGCIENFNYQYEHPKDSFVLRIWMGTDK
jgi:hypothetical protein